MTSLDKHFALLQAIPCLVSWERHDPRFLALASTLSVRHLGRVRVFIVINTFRRSAIFAVRNPMYLLFSISQ